MSRPKGAKNKNPAQGRKTVFKTMSISGKQGEIEYLKQLAEKNGKTVSRLVLDWALAQPL
mgnify:FL=1